MLAIDANLWPVLLYKRCLLAGAIKNTFVKQALKPFDRAGMADAPTPAPGHPAPPDRKNTMRRSFDTAQFAKVATCMALAVTASALTLSGALLAVVS